MALVVGEQLKEKLHGMLLYAPAINYVYPYFERQLAKLPPNLQQKILDGDQHIMSMQSMGNALMKRDFAEDSRTFEINLKEPLDIVNPVRILHGLNDAEVPFEQSIQLCQDINQSVFHFPSVQQSQSFHFVICQVFRRFKLLFATLPFVA